MKKVQFSAALFLFLAPWLSGINPSGLCDLASQTVVIRKAGTPDTLVCNEERAAIRYPACSTFKIANALIAIDSNIVAGPEKTFRYDPSKHAHPHRKEAAYNKDQTLESAFKDSVLWVFQDIARAVGEAKYREYLRRFDYGNEDLSAGVDQFWLESLHISAKEQVRFLERFHGNDFKLESQAVETVKDLMLLETGDNYRVYGKTGTALPEDGNWFGWIVGFIELRDAVYFYAINLDAPSYGDLKTERMRILKKCLSAILAENESLKTSEILVTSEAGDKLARKENVAFRQGNPDGTVIEIFPEARKQTIDGIGSSFTESSAFVLAHLEEDRRHEVMRNIYGSEGANFTLTRTHIGACDFSVEGKYSYAPSKEDCKLQQFTIAEDRKGFDARTYPGVVDESYDLLPMIHEALDIKGAQDESTLRIIGSAWTAPPWMKDIGDWYIPGSPANNYQGTGGSLKKEHYATYANYLVKFLEAYSAEGVDIWGLTPVNEPHGNNGQWESMQFTPESQNTFIKDFLGPRLVESSHADTRLLIYDQNRDGMEEWADLIFGDPETAPFTYGIAVHWYESTYKVFEDHFQRVHEKFPDKAIVHTEGCIDDLGKPAPQGILDPEGYQESGWFANDAFWWNPNATDWAYTATWPGVIQENHPKYTPVHRYARNIIVSLDNWATGWVDWNIVLDHKGGPNHVGNFCGAPIMIHTETKEVYYTPVFHVLSQFSRTIRPGDTVVQTRRQLNGLDEDALHACATLNKDNLLSVQVLNTTREPLAYQLKIGGEYATVEIPANAVQTVQIQL